MPGRLQPHSPALGAVFAIHVLVWGRVVRVSARVSSRNATVADGALSAFL
jgi:hypothetical protein